MQSLPSAMTVSGLWQKVSFQPGSCTCATDTSKPPSTPSSATAVTSRTGAIGQKNCGVTVYLSPVNCMGALPQLAATVGK